MEILSLCFLLGFLCAFLLGVMVGTVGLGFRGLWRGLSGFARGLVR
jgi:hypothetical protein